MVGTTTSPRRIDLGDCSVTVFCGGGLKLDGGAMFGIIPKPLWQRRAPADDENRIPLACNCLLVEWRGAGGRYAIIETGHGAKYEAKECAIYAIDPFNWLLPNLRQAGIDERAISDVIVTHLHFDHAGGLTQVVDGRTLPTFPDARVHVQKQEFQDARANFGIMHATYREENFAPLDACDAWSLHGGETAVLENIRLVPTPGHTRGHQSVIVSGSNRTVLFAGDVMPTAAHLGAAWNMGYDLLPLDNRESKRKLLRQAARERWIVVLDHEPSAPVVTVRDEDMWFKLTPFQ